MKNILLVLQREYLVRVKKKSFIIMTLLTPLLMLAFYGFIIWAAIGNIDTKNINILDESGLFTGEFKDTESLKFNYLTVSADSAKSALKTSGANALVVIPENILTNPKNLKIYAEKNVSLELKSSIENVIERQIENIKLTEAGITRKILEDSRVNVSSQTISINEGVEQASSSVAATIIGGICAFLIYLTLIIYGTQVMRGVTEEKTSRIVEVIISSIKPMHLMMGKILGVALVGLTQFVLWIIFTIGLVSATSAIFADKMPSSTEQAFQTAQDIQKQTNPAAAQLTQNVENPIADIQQAIDGLNIPLIIGAFLFYFLGGYLLYSALFGAIGAAVDNDSDTQQFIFPIMMPIIFSIAIAQFVIREPDGSMAFWTSMFPFTSPVIMMIRIPFGVPVWELVLSMALLVLGFICTIWIASRIYRIGILMYGKKITYKELGKWLFYKP